MSSNANLYGIGSSGTSLGSTGVLPVIQTRNPSTSDIIGPSGNFVVGQVWINTVLGGSFQLTGISSFNGVVSATWIELGAGTGSLDSLSADVGNAFPTSGNIKIAGGTGIATSASGSTVTVAISGIDIVSDITVDASTSPGTNPVTPNGSGIVTVTGGQIAAGTTANAIRTDSLAANTYTIEIQRSQAVGSSTVGDNGISHFNSADFTVDGNGFVSSVGGAFSRMVGVDASTSPGTDPVLPTTGGLITVTGSQVAAGTIPNVIRTDSLAANTYTIEIQRSQAVASTTIADNGVCHFDSSSFSVDANGFVTLAGQGEAIDSVNVDAHTSPGTDPVLPASDGSITVTGAQIGSASIPNVIRTNSLSPNSYTIEVQRSAVRATPNSAFNGVSHFNSADFTIDSTGFVSSIGGGFARTVGVQSSTSPGTNPVAPTSGGLITVDGGTVVAGTVPVQTNSLAANTYTVQVQTSQALAAADATKIGLSNFNSSDFTVDSTGFVSAIGGGFTREVMVESSMAPGTNPVLPDSGGVITVNGGVVAAGTDPVQTTSLAANSYTIQVQTAQAVASPDATKIGLATFKSTDFTVDSTGFVSAIASTNISSGSWTPTLEFGGSSTGIGYSSRFGNYITIGTPGSGNALVMLTGSVELSSKGAQTGQATITGIPYDTTSDTVYGVLSYDNLTPSTGFGGGVCQLDSITSPLKMLVLPVDTSSNAAFISDTNFSDTSIVSFTISYQA